MRPSHWPSTTGVLGLSITLIMLIGWAAGVYTLTLCIAATALSGLYLIVSSSASPGLQKGEAICALLLLSLILLSVVPVPISKLVSITQTEQNQIAMSAVAAAVRSDLAESSPTWFALTRDRAGTHRYLLMMISAVAAAGIVCRLSSRHRAFLLHSLVVLSALVAVFGFHSQHTYPQGDYLWWTFEVPHGIETVGCFVNRNHFGGYVGMFAPVALVLLADACRRRRWEWGVLHAVCFVVLGIAVAASKSRGALLACGVGTGATLVLIIARRRLGAAVLGILLVGGIAGAVRFAPLGEVQDRLQSFTRLPETLSARLRLSTWKDATRIIADYPLMGVGANAFRMVFPQYRTASTRKSFYHAENEYIQIPVELGITGVVLIVGMFGFSIRTWRHASSSGSVSAETGLAIAGAAMVVAAHAAVDFALRTPLYTITCGCLWGMVLGAPARAGDQPAGAAAPSMRRLVLAALPACLGIVYALNAATDHRTIDRFDSSDFVERAKPQQLVRALTWSPTSWVIWYHLGRQACVQGTPEGVDLCVKWVRQSADYNPNDYRIWQNLADLLEHRAGDIDGARRAMTRARALRSWLALRPYEEQPEP